MAINNSADLATKSHSGPAYWALMKSIGLCRQPDVDFLEGSVDFLPRSSWQIKIPPLRAHLIV
eukprot:5488196-Amphidinium_carterae.1